jgi:four helix bundle protein
VREASRTRLDAEFISKLGGALQETDVTQLWLELLSEECRIQSSFTNPMHHESDELIAIMTTIIRKTNRGKTDGGKKVESRKQMKEKQRKAES